jgi:hypothetical protein
VIAGRYPSAIEQVWLNPPECVLDLAFGRARAQRLSHGREPTVFTNVEILISEFYVGIDCDSRTYAAKVVSLRQVKADLMLASNDPPSGC